MSVPYYTGDTVPLAFTVSDKDGAVNPTAATVLLRKSTRDIVSLGDADVSGNEVSYLVPSYHTDNAGKHEVFFTVGLPGGGERTHLIEFTILHNINPPGS